MAGHAELPEIATRKFYPFLRQDDPHIRALVPRASAVVAEHALRRETRRVRADWSSARRTACETSARSDARVDGAPALDVALLERREPAARDPGAPIRRASGGRRRSRGRASARGCRYSRQFGTSGTRSMPNVAPRASTRATESSVAVEIALASERLENAVRRQHHREAAPAKRQRANVAAHERDGSRRRRSGSSGPGSRACEHRRRAIDADESTPPFASGIEMRPVPQPSSSTRPRRRAATRRQNGTSRRPSVRAFSQS